MRWLHVLRLRARTLFRRALVDRELDAELEFYIDQRARQAIERGLAPGAAREQARRSIGSLTRVRERVRESRRVPLVALLDESRRNARLAWRTCLSRPGFACAVIVTVALGVGANTAVFGVVHAVLLQSLPYPDGDRVVAVWFTPESQPAQEAGTNALGYFTIRDNTQVFESVGTVRLSNAFNVGADSPSGPSHMRVPAQWFTFGTIEVLAAPPLMGQWPAPDDAGTVVISHRLWRELYGGREDALGQELRVENFAPLRIVGVMPAGFELMEPSDFWLVQRDDDLRRSLRADNRIFTLIARMKPGVTLAQAQAEMDRLAEALAEEMPESHTGWGIRVESLHDVAVGSVRTPLLVFQGAVLLVLLMACLNVSGLLIARASTRQQELALRAAIGARRGHLVRQLMTESLMLALPGGALGVLLAWGGLRLFAAISSLGLSPAELAPNRAVLGVTLLMTIGSGVLFGVLPALSVSRPDVMRVLREAMRGGTDGAARHRLRAALVVVQVALALVLLVGAGLMLNSFVRLMQVDPGFETERLISFQVPLSRSFYSPADTAPFDVELGSRIDDLSETIRRRLEVVPGVRSAALTVTPPLSGRPFEMHFAEVGHSMTTSEAQRWFAEWYPVGAGYFETLGLPLVRGRRFAAEDVGTGPPVALVNEALANHFWPGQEPVGKRIQLDLPYDQPREVIGVVGDVRQDLYQRDGSPQLYVPRPQLPRQMNMVTAQRTMLANTFVVRTIGDPAQTVAALRAALNEVDSTQVMTEVHTVDAYASRQLDRTRETSVILSLFGFVSIVLAVVGLYAIVAHIVSQRTREIGIRIALGARTGAVLQLILRQGLRLVVVGMVLGLAASLLLTRAMQSLLWSVSPTDPLTFALVTVTLFGVGVLACILPARRAARIDPLLVIKD